MLAGCRSYVNKYILLYLGSVLNSTQIAGCSQSSQYQQYTCDKAIDGDQSTYWQTSTTTLGQWIKVDFVLLQEVQAIELW